jgi:hypothetical protein
VGTVVGEQDGGTEGEIVGNNVGAIDGLNVGPTGAREGNSVGK